MDVWVGLDLGQLTDYSALSVMGRSLAIDAATGLPLRTSSGDLLHRWDLVALRRWHLGTPYTAIVKDVVRIMQRPELGREPRLVVDGTGVGVAVVEMVRTAMAKLPRVDTWAITITAGRTWSIVRYRTINCAKIELVGAVREVLESRRLKIARTSQGDPIPYADLLKRELVDFRVKITASANESFEARQGAHDDLVLSVALPIWAGTLRLMEMRQHADGDAEPLRPRERAAISSEQEAIEEAEQEALALERGEITAKRAALLEAERIAQEQELTARLWDDKYWQ
jgi:hypothetical protein